VILAVDVSNTSIKLGVFQGETLLASFRIASDRQRLADDYGMLLLGLLVSAKLSPADFRGAVVSCVVPPLRSVFEDVCRKYLGVTPVVVSPEIRTGVTLLVDNPREVGADRIVNALATHRRHGGPAISIAFGTATVFDCVSPDGAYMGGAIAPGMVTALESLARSAAQLFQIELVAPKAAIGKNTVNTMQSGLVLGFAGLVEGLTSRLRAEMGGVAKVIATGGLADVVAPATSAIDVVDPHLTLQGLRLIYELNAGD
jgi:type III pantothenate kinase